MVRELGGGYDMAGGCFTNMCYIILKTTTRCMPPTDVVAVWGAVFLRLHGVADLYKQ